MIISSDPAFSGSAWLYMTVLDENENSTTDSLRVIVYPVTSIEIGKQKNIPQEFSLYQNYPNPFNPSTTIEFALPKASEVTLQIFNILGEEVVTLVSDRLNAGKYKVKWNVYLQGEMASGVYLYRLKAGDFVKTCKMLLIQ